MLDSDSSKFHWKEVVINRDKLNEFMINNNLDNSLLKDACARYCNIDFNKIKSVSEYKASDVNNLDILVIYENPNFITDYVEHILSNIGKADVIFVSTHEDVIDALYYNGIPFIILFPYANDNKKLQEIKYEYLRRYKIRGSDNNFINLIDKNFEIWVETLKIKSDDLGIFNLFLSKEDHILDIWSGLSTIRYNVVYNKYPRYKPSLIVDDEVLLPDLLENLTDYFKNILHVPDYNQIDATDKARYINTKEGAEIVRKSFYNIRYSSTLYFYIHFDNGEKRYWMSVMSKLYLTYARILGKKIVYLSDINRQPYILYEEEQIDPSAV